MFSFPLFKMITEVKSLVMGLNFGVKLEYIDEEELLRAFGGDLEILDEIISKFLEIYASELQSLEDKIREKKFSDIEYISHNLKGSASNFRPKNILHTLFEMEKYSREKNIEQLFELLPIVKKSFHGMAKDLKKLKTH